MTDVDDCTGETAVWCANCGNCTCFDKHIIETGHYDDPACPLHGERNTHGYEFDDSHPAFAVEDTEVVPLPSARQLIESERGRMSDEWVDQMLAIHKVYEDAGIR